jgi:hypothetical protein
MREDDDSAANGGWENYCIMDVHCNFVFEVTRMWS